MEQNERVDNIIVTRDIILIQVEFKEEIQIAIVIYYIHLKILNSRKKKMLKL